MTTTAILPTLSATWSAADVPWALLAAGAAAGLVALAFALASRLPRRAPRWILRALGAHPLGHLEAPAFRDAVRRMARLFHMREPALYVVPHAQANVFVFAAHDGTPVVAVTEGALRALSPAETEAAVGVALARGARADLVRSTVAAGLGLGVTAAAGMGIMPGRMVEEHPWGWPLGIPFILLGALLARNVGGSVPCSHADLRGASISGRSEECARLLEHMEFTAHAEPMAVPSALSRLAMVHPRGEPAALSMAGLFPAPKPSAGRAALLRGVFPADDPSRAHAA